jgi:hypothetical protein
MEILLTKREENFFRLIFSALIQSIIGSILNYKNIDQFHIMVTKIEATSRKPETSLPFSSVSSVKRPFFRKILFPSSFSLCPLLLPVSSFIFGLPALFLKQFPSHLLRQEEDELGQG